MHQRTKLDQSLLPSQSFHKKPSYIWLPPGPYLYYEVWYIILLNNGYADSI